MLTRRIAVTAATVLTTLSIPATSHAEDDRGSGGIECGLYTCQVAVDVPGQGGGQAGGTGGGGPSGGSDDGSYVNPDGTLDTVCKYKLADPQPPAGSLEWDGHKPGDGAVYEQSCSMAPDGTEDLWVIRMVWLAEPPEQEAVAPTVLAQRAVDSMTLLGPDIASPRAAWKYTVGVPMWMWVNQSATTYGPNTASASAGGITVTATAKVSKIVWQMGDGASVTCKAPARATRHPRAWPSRRRAVTCIPRPQLVPGTASSPSSRRRPGRSTGRAAERPASSPRSGSPTCR